jgi:signal transduction histidine kinase
VTKIGLFVALAKQKTAQHPELQDLFTKISANTHQLADGVRDFIWVTDPEKDSLFEIISRLKRFGDELFDYSDVIFEIGQLRHQWKKHRLSVDERRHILLIFKEAMNNCLKYADAERVFFIAKEEADSYVELILKDDGKGFDPDQVTEGYGLTNMQRRAQKIGADLKIVSKKPGGSSVSLRFKIPQM